MQLLPQTAWSAVPYLPYCLPGLSGTATSLRLSRVSGPSKFADACSHRGPCPSGICKPFSLREPDKSPTSSRPGCCSGYHVFFTCSLAKEPTPGPFVIKTSKTLSRGTATSLPSMQSKISHRAEVPYPTPLVASCRLMRNSASARGWLSCFLV